MFAQCVRLGCAQSNSPITNLGYNERSPTKTNSDAQALNDMFPFKITRLERTTCVQRAECASSRLVRSFQISSLLARSFQLHCTTDVVQGQVSHVVKDQSAVEELEKILFSSTHLSLHVHRLTSSSKSNSRLNRSYDIFSVLLSWPFCTFFSRTK